MYSQDVYNGVEMNGSLEGQHMSRENKVYVVSVRGDSEASTLWTSVHITQRGAANGVVNAIKLIADSTSEQPEDLMSVPESVFRRDTFEEIRDNDVETLVFELDLTIGGAEYYYTVMHVDIED